jgi:ABC-type multidrug transport system ATPase subunit
MTRRERQHGLGGVVEHADLAWRNDERVFAHSVLIRTGFGANRDHVTDGEFVEAVERRAIRGAVPCDSCVTDFAWHRRGRIVTRAAAQRRHGDVIDDGTVHVDLRYANDRNRVAGGRGELGDGGGRLGRGGTGGCGRRSGGGSGLRDLFLEITAQITLGARLDDARPPQLKADEAQHQDADHNQGPADPFEDVAPISHHNRLRRCAVADSANVHIRFDRAAGGFVDFGVTPSGVASMESPRALPAVLLRDAVVLLGGFPALAGCNLELAVGDRMLVTGANGTGKTTLLRAIAGLTPLTRGSVLVLGSDVRTDAHSIRKRLGFVGHDTFSYDELTPWENLALTLRLRGTDRSAIDNQVRETLARCGIERVADVRSSGLSSGQRRRLGIARAVVGRPDVLLLDEPQANLDADGRALVGAIIADAAAAGQTVIVVSHEPEALRPLMTREIALIGGQAVEQASALQVSA